MYFSQKVSTSLQNTSQSRLFGENLTSSHGPYGHFHKDGLPQIKNKNWVGEENVDISGGVENGGKSEVPGRVWPGVENDARPRGIILGVFLASLRLYRSGNRFHKRQNVKN